MQAKLRMASPAVKKAHKSSVGKVQAANRQTSSDIDAKPFLSLSSKGILLLLLAAFILFGILYFDARLFLMGDDADYIMDAYQFIHSGVYPTGRSSFYAMVLGLPIAIFSTQVLPLKIFSFLCAITGFCLLFRSFYGKISGWILYPVLLFSIVNSSMQYYSSSNLSEAFFMMIQYGYIAAVFLLIHHIGSGTGNKYKYWLLVGLMSLLITISKNIAIVAPFSLTLYFLCQKQVRYALFSVFYFILFKIPYELLLRLIIKQNTLVSHWDQVLAKDLYHHEKGRETFSGFLDRFLSNSQIYLAHVSLREFGFNLNKPAYGWATVLLILFLLFGLFHAWRHNKYVFMAGLYTMVMCVGIFFALQPAVAQDRIIIILVPLLLLMFLYALFVLLGYRQKGVPIVRYIVMGTLLLFLFIVHMQRAAIKIRETLPTLSENLGGDPTYGYTPDWINYLAMGKWVKEHLPDSVVVAARKPNSLTVHSNGRPFKGIYNFPTNLNANQLLALLQKDHIRYLVVANLRADPDVYNPKMVITTLHQYIITIEKEYPKTFRIVHRTGTQEPCLLVEIRYPQKLKKM